MAYTFVVECLDVLYYLGIKTLHLTNGKKYLQPGGSFLLNLSGGCKSKEKTKQTKLLLVTST